MQKHWYKKHITMCPVCQKEHIELERIYGERPKDYEDRQSTIEVYDWCNE